MNIEAIAGAGYSGCVAAFAFPNLPIYEARPEPTELHAAVLRFGTDRIATLTGIEFRPVTVRKAIAVDGREVAPTIAMSNQYSRKVTGRISNSRSIWRLEPVERWIAPPNWYAQMIDRLNSRIAWASPWPMWSSGRPVLSTVPLDVTLRAVGLESPFPLNYAPIHVERYLLPEADVFQTVYFPSPDTDVYRASITGDTLIIEAVGPNFDISEIMSVFGATAWESIVTTEQRYGKIDYPEDQLARRGLLAQLTIDHGIYSLGRFATWRNVLLDDLPHDCRVIRRLAEGCTYTARLAAAK
jgi:hypothetical protein